MKYCQHFGSWDLCEVRTCTSSQIRHRNELLRPAGPALIGSSIRRSHGWMGLFQWLPRPARLRGFSVRDLQSPRSTGSRTIHTGVRNRPRNGARKSRLCPLRFNPSPKVGGGHDFAEPARVSLRSSEHNRRLAGLEPRGVTASRLERYSLPVFNIPEELAQWLEIPLGHWLDGAPLRRRTESG